MKWGNSSPKTTYIQTNPSPSFHPLSCAYIPVKHNLIIKKNQNKNDGIPKNVPQLDEEDVEQTKISIKNGKNNERENNYKYVI